MNARSAGIAVAWTLAAALAVAGTAAIGSGSTAGPVGPGYGVRLDVPGAVPLAAGRGTGRHGVSCPSDH